MSVGSLGGAKPLRAMPTPEEQDKKLREVSEMYEKQFLREMMKAMRGTVSESGFIKTSQAEKIFRDQLDGEYADRWGDKGGIGLADMIHKQLVEKYGTQLGLKAPVAKPAGPIGLGETANFTGRTVPGERAGRGGVTYRFDRDPSAAAEFRAPGLGEGIGRNALKAPWDGVLAGVRKIGTDEHLVELSHDNGLKSRFVFKGMSASGLSDGRVQAGQTIGVLSPEARSFFWTLESGKTSSEE